MVFLASPRFSNPLELSQSVPKTFYSIHSFVLFSSTLLYSSYPSSPSSSLFFFFFFFFSSSSSSSLWFLPLSGHIYLFASLLFLIPPPTPPSPPDCFLSYKFDHLPPFPRPISILAELSRDPKDTCCLFVVRCRVDLSSTAYAPLASIACL